MHNGDVHPFYLLMVLLLMAAIPLVEIVFHHRASSLRSQLSLTNERITKQQRKISSWSHIKNATFPYASSPIPIVPVEMKRLNSSLPSFVEYRRNLALLFERVNQSVVVAEMSRHLQMEPWDVHVECPNKNHSSVDEPSHLGVIVVAVDCTVGQCHDDDENIRNHASLLDGALENWSENLAYFNRTPLIIFHRGPFPQKSLSLIQERFGNCKFVEIWGEGSWKTFQRVFFLSQFYTMMDSNTRGYDYYMRLDVNFRFRHVIRYDLFQFMHRNRLMIGFTQLGLLDTVYRKEMYHTLHERVWSYCLQQGILPLGEMRQDGDFGAHDTLHAGPFEISHFAVYQNENYGTFLESIDAMDGIVEERWSEWNVKTQWIKIHVPRIATHWFCDVSSWYLMDFPQRCSLKCL